MNSTSIQPRSPASWLTDQAPVVFEALRRHAGSTSAELAKHAGVDQHAVARLLPDLEKLDLVRKGESRRCKVTRRNDITWFCTHCGEQGRLFE